MVTRAQKVRVIIFISTVSIIFLYILFILVGQKLFRSEDTYYITLKNQSSTGINVGQDVRYYGINIGKVTEISINKLNIEEIILTVSVKSGTPLKKTVKANLNFQGITGLKVIELSGGKNSDQDLKPGSYIKAEIGMLDNITSKAEDITEKIDKVLNNILEMTDKQSQTSFKNIIAKVDSTVKHVDMMVVTTGKIIADNQQEISNLIVNANTLSVSLTQTSNSIRLLANNGNKIIGSKETAKILANITGLSNKLNSAKTDSIITNMNELIGQSKEMIWHLDKTFMRNRQNIVKSIELTKETLDNFNEFIILLRENPDIIWKGKQNE